VPGLALIKFLDREGKRINLALTLNITSFFTGFAYLILQYYLLTWLNIRFLLLIISPVTATVLIYKNRKSYSYKYFLNSKNLMSEYGLITICTTLIASVVSLLWRFPQPHLVGKFSLNIDFLWQIGNVNLLSGNTFSDPRVSQLTFVYHYFSNLFFAVHKILLDTLGLFQDDNLVNFNLLMQYQFIIIGILMGGSFYLLYKQIFKSDVLACILAISSLFILPVDPWGVYHDAFLFHWTTNINATGLSIPLFVIANVLLFPYLIKSEKKNSIWINVFLALILSIMLNGFKGPIGLMVVASITIFSFVELILSKNVESLIRKKIFISRLFISLLFVIGFIFIYITLLSAGSGTVSINFNSTQLIGQYPIFQGILSNLGNQLWLTIGLRIIHLAYFSNGAGFLFLCGVIFLLVKIKKEGYHRKFNVLIFCAITAKTGIIPFYIIEHSGGSQLYFYFAAIPFITVIAAFFVVEFSKLIISKTSSRKKILFKSTIYLFAILIIFWGVYGNGRLLSTASLRNDNPLQGRGLRFSNEELLSYPSSQITFYEFQALHWLFNNTEIDSLIATNRQEIAPDDYRFFYFSAFSNRNFLIEGFRFAANLGFPFEEALELLRINNQLFTENYIGKHTLAIELGVNYLFISRYSEYNYSPNEEGFSLVFENRDVRIYVVLY